MQDGDMPVPEVAAKAISTFSEIAWHVAIRDAQRIIEEGSRSGITAIGITASGYPARLRIISDAPVVIYVKGNVDVLARDAIAVVGTRNVSAAGTRLAKLIAGYVARRGYVVVSGLALGVDSLAHEAALEANALTVAVLAHGLDTVASTSHRKLAERILASGGTLMSEHHHGVPARPQEFVRRNRLQSGLSIGSIVVESGIVGGSMHHARFTKNQGRHLFAPLASSAASRGDLDESGALELIDKLGAIPIRTLGDLGRELDRIKSQPTPVIAPVDLF
ncbi:MAG: DNA-processing protein DprA [Planctomycetota bacterium]|nr:DNA-processing protein DprA [Planctomycetota bacterium]